MIASLLLMSVPTFVLMAVLALVAWLGLRGRGFWSWAAPLSLVAGTLIGSVFYVSSAAELGGFSAAAQLVVVAGAAPLLMLQPVMGETDPVVLAPLVPLLLSLGCAALVLAVLAGGQKHLGAQA